MISAFGIEHGSEVSKGLGKFLKLGRSAKSVEKPFELNFKPIKPGVKPTGPGSMRGSMDPSAHETRIAAAKAPRPPAIRTQGGTPSDVFHAMPESPGKPSRVVRRRKKS